MNFNFTGSFNRFELGISNIKTKNNYSNTAVISVSDTNKQTLFCREMSIAVDHANGLHLAFRSITKCSLKMAKMLRKL